MVPSDHRAALTPAAGSTRQPCLSLTLTLEKLFAAPKPFTTLWHRRQSCGVCGNGRASAPRDGRVWTPADILGGDGEVNVPPRLGRYRVMPISERLRSS